MSCVSSAMLIDEQSGEHDVALGSELALLSFHCCLVKPACHVMPPTFLLMPPPALKPEMQLRCRVCNLLNRC